MTLLLKILKKIKRLIYRRPYFISLKFLKFFFRKNEFVFLYICEDVSNLNYTLNLLKKNISSDNNLIIVYLDDPSDRDLLGCSHIENDYENLLISYRKFKTGKVDAYNRVMTAYGFLFDPIFLIWLNKNNIDEAVNIEKIKNSIDLDYNIYLSSKKLHNTHDRNLPKILETYSINSISDYDFSYFMIFYRYSILKQIGFLPSSIYPDNLLLLRFNALQKIKYFDSDNMTDIDKLSLEIDQSYLRSIDRHADASYIDEFINLYSSSIYKSSIYSRIYNHIVESEKTKKLESEHKERFSKLIFKT